MEAYEKHDCGAPAPAANPRDGSESVLALLLSPLSSRAAAVTSRAPAVAPLPRLAKLGPMMADAAADKDVAADAAAAEDSGSDMMETLTTGAFFGLW